MAFKTSCRVEFRDTDAAGIVHFSVFFNYMERAEHELLRSIGSSVIKVAEDGSTISWPRVATSCDYQGVARFEDELDVEVRVDRLGTKSIRYQFRFGRGDEEIARGTTTAVYCHVKPGGHLHSVPIPPELRTQLAQFCDHDDGEA